MTTIETKVTKLGNGQYGCRLIVNSKPAIEVRVNEKYEIQPAIKDMLRTIDKMGSDNQMASASRHRDNGMPVNKYKFIWL